MGASESRPESTPEFAPESAPGSAAAGERGPYKVFIVGEAGDGAKSALMHQRSTAEAQAASEDTLHRLGVTFVSHTVVVDGTPVRLQLWGLQTTTNTQKSTSHHLTSPRHNNKTDTAGQERFRQVGAGLLRGADAVIVVFSLADADVLTRLPAWLAFERETGRVRGRVLRRCGLRRGAARGRCGTGAGRVRGRRRRLHGGGAQREQRRRGGPARCRRAQGARTRAAKEPGCSWETCINTVRVFGLCLFFIPSPNALSFPFPSATPKQQQ